MHKLKQRWRVGLLAALLTLAFTLVGQPAQAMEGQPRVLFEPQGDCSRDYCVTYARSAELPSGTLVATFEDNNQPAEGQVFPIYSSWDDGQTWTRTSEVPDTSPRGWALWASPQLYVLPEPIGDMPAGTLLLAGIASPADHSETALELYRSDDEGQSWSWVSEITVGGGEWGSADPTPIWEPFLLATDGKLIVYYSDERDKANHDQKLVHQTSTDGVSWGPIVEDVALADRNLRPGMPTVAQMSDGRYIMTYEVVGRPDIPNNYQISDDPEQWNPLDEGTTIDHGGSPVVLALPDGRLAYNSGGSPDIRINSTNGAGAWTPVQTNMPAGYSRWMQPVSDTGRVLILSVECFCSGHRNTIYYGDVDLGNSAGPYYEIVNRNSGQVLDVFDASIQDGASVVQWPGNGGANQRWHVSDTGDGYVNLLAGHSGRALAIGGSDTADGTDALTWVENGFDDQDWRLEPVDGAYVEIVNRNSGKCLEVEGFSTDDGAPVQQWDCHGGQNQQWELVQVG
ncbi:RICIN domain-containing protein [Glycomyces tenuis]|uniref:RICIN domain-containing protein n=1 Tax=Glycomyces tenuis TaxID=58116 RepID=UPI00040EAB59|nr:RICIN domain-containing protein [Glycomyces tenuis]